MNATLDATLAASAERYRAGTCRDRIMHDLILADAARIGPALTFLDIGCGKGFDSDVPLQRSLARAAGRYLGIEPDPSVVPGAHIQEVHRCLFEQSSLPPASVHIAFAIMVLEHVPAPQPFWDRVYEVLVPGGVFWALTVDARHWFCVASTWSEKLRVKELYLRWLLGVRGTGERYENYPVHYRCNTPAAVEHYAQEFSSVRTWNLAKIGQCDPIFPRSLRPLSHRLDSRAIRRQKPGTLLVIRAEK